MIKHILFFSILEVLLAYAGFVRGHGLDLGLMNGEPTSISCKDWVTNSRAIQLEIGYLSLSNSQGTAISFEFDSGYGT